MQAAAMGEMFKFSWTVGGLCDLEPVPALPPFAEVGFSAQSDGVRGGRVGGEVGAADRECARELTDLAWLDPEKLRAGKYSSASVHACAVLQLKHELKGRFIGEPAGGIGGSADERWWDYDRTSANHREEVQWGELPRSYRGPRRHEKWAGYVQGSLVDIGDLPRSTIAGLCWQHWGYNVR